MSTKTSQEAPFVGVSDKTDYLRAMLNSITSFRNYLIRNERQLDLLGWDEGS